MRESIKKLKVSITKTDKGDYSIKRGIPNITSNKSNYSKITVFGYESFIEEFIKCVKYAETNELKIIFSSEGLDNEGESELVILVTEHNQKFKTILKT